MRPSSRSPFTLLLVLCMLLLACRPMAGGSPRITLPPAATATATFSTPASPPPSAPTASPSAAVTPVAAFFDHFAGDPPPYRVLMEVDIGGVSQGTARIEADVDGPDYHATVQVAVGDLPPRDSEIIFVDGTGYLREAGDEQWVVVPGYRSTPPLNPFLFLDPSDYADRGSDPARDGLHHLASGEWVEEDATLGYEQGGVRDVGFDVWLDEHGVPVEANLEFVLAGTDASGQQVALTYAARYVFSDVGADISIEAPVPPS